MLLALFTGAAGTAWADTKTDVLTRESTGATSSNYTSWTFNGSSGAIYAGMSAGSQESIQLRSDKTSSGDCSGVVVTTTPGTFKSIELKWHSETFAGRTVQVYGSNTAYTSPNDLFDQDKQGTLIGEMCIDNATNGITSLTATDAYPYMGFRSKRGALYLPQVSIVWDAGDNRRPANLSYATTSYTITQGESFTAPTLTNPNNLTVTYSSSDTNVATVDRSSGRVTLGNAVGTTTITASFAGNNSYLPGSANYTLTVKAPAGDISNIATLTSQEAGDYNLTLTRALITYIDPSGKYGFLQDASGAIMVFDQNGRMNDYANYGIAAGTTLTGTANVTLAIYNNLPEITSINNLEQALTSGAIVAARGQAPSPVTVTLAQLTGNFSNYMSRYLKLEGVTVTKDGNNFVLNQGDASLQFYGRNNSKVEEGRTYNLIGNPGVFKTTNQFVVYDPNNVEDATPSSFITTELSFEPDILEMGVGTEDEAYLYTNLTSLEGVVIENSNPEVATWESDVVTALSPGVTTITATIPATNDHSAATATLKVTVTDPNADVIVFANLNYQNTDDVTEVVSPSGASSLFFDKGEGSNPPKYYDTGEAVRMYNKNTLRFLSDREIVKIIFTFSGNGYSHLLLGDDQPGTYADGVWEGSAQEVTFTNDETPSRIQQIMIFYGEGAFIPHLNITFNDVTGAPIDALTMAPKEDVQVYMTVTREGQALNWVPFQVESSDPDVVEVEEGNGMSLILSANGEGTATITVTIDDGETENAESFYGATATLTVKVEIPEEVIDGYVFYKVNAIDEITPNDRVIIVYEGAEQSYALNGALENPDQANNGIPVTYNDLGIIATNKLMDATYNFSETSQETDESVIYGYAISDTQGRSLGWNSNSKNGLTVTDTAVLFNTVSFDEEGNAVITGAGGYILQFNSNRNDMRFRYYSGSQKPIALFRYVDQTTGIDAVREVLSSDNATFDLTGRRVKVNKAGLYIVGGKKVVVK